MQECMAENRRHSGHERRNHRERWSSKACSHPKLGVRQRPKRRKILPTATRMAMTDLRHLVRPSRHSQRPGGAGVGSAHDGGVGGVTVLSDPFPGAVNAARHLLELVFGKCFLRYLCEGHAESSWRGIIKKGARNANLAQWVLLRGVLLVRETALGVNLVAFFDNNRGDFFGQDTPPLKAT